jgi:hypothetical protein
MIGYHSSNPKYRKVILENGLKALTGFSYKYNHGNEVMPAIFFSLTWKHRFISTYDDDFYKVNLLNVICIPDPKNIKHVMTYQSHILPKYFKIIYKGTGV